MSSHQTQLLESNCNHIPNNLKILNFCDTSIFQTLFLINNAEVSIPSNKNEDDTDYFESDEFRSWASPHEEAKILCWKCYRKLLPFMQDLLKVIFDDVLLNYSNLPKLSSKINSKNYNNRHNLRKLKQFDDQAFDYYNNINTLYYHDFLTDILKFPIVLKYIYRYCTTNQCYRYFIDIWVMLLYIFWQTKYSKFEHISSFPVGLQVSYFFRDEYCRSSHLLYWKREHFYYACNVNVGIIDDCGRERININGSGLNVLNFLFKLSLIRTRNPKRIEKEIILANADHQLRKYSTPLNLPSDLYTKTLFSGETTDLPGLAVDLLYFCKKFNHQWIDKQYSQQFAQFGRRVAHLMFLHKCVKKYKKNKVPDIDTIHTFFLNGKASHVIEYIRSHSGNVTVAKLINNKHEAISNHFVLTLVRSCGHASCERNKYVQIDMINKQDIVDKGTVIYNLVDDMNFIKTKFYKCKRCEMVKYCSKKCQKADWKNHRNLCDYMFNTVRKIKQYSMVAQGLRERRESMKMRLKSLKSM